jgi:hypothetical protein
VSDDTEQDFAHRSYPSEMFEEERCTHTELYVSQCAHCRGEQEASPYEGVLIERFVVARYVGDRCMLIPDHRLEVGTTIGLAVYENDGERLGWVCAECVEKLTS